MQMPNVCENVMSDSNDDSFYLCSYRNTWAILYFFIVIFLLMLFFLRQCSAAMNAHSSLRMVLVFLCVSDITLPDAAAVSVWSLRRLLRAGQGDLTFPSF